MPTVSEVLIPLLATYAGVVNPRLGRGLAAGALVSSRMRGEREDRIQRERQQAEQEEERKRREGKEAEEKLRESERVEYAARVAQSIPPGPDAELLRDTVISNPSLAPQIASEVGRRMEQQRVAEVAEKGKREQTAAAAASAAELMAIYAPAIAALPDGQTKQLLLWAQKHDPESVPKMWREVTEKQERIAGADRAADDKDSSAAFDRSFKGKMEAYDRQLEFVNKNWETEEQRLKKIDSQYGEYRKRAGVISPGSSLSTARGLSEDDRAAVKALEVARVKSESTLTELDKQRQELQTAINKLYEWRNNYLAAGASSGPPGAAGPPGNSAGPQVAAAPPAAQEAAGRALARQIAAGQ